MTSRVKAFMASAAMQRRNDELAKECLIKLLTDIELFAEVAAEERIPRECFVGVLNKNLIAVCIAGYIKMGMPEKIIEDLYDACVQEAREYCSDD